jgi:hypothetical protein
VNNTTEQLTREQILAMPEGTSLDEAVGERVMMWSRQGTVWIESGSSLTSRAVHPYSTSMDHAWEVAHVMGIDDNGIHWRDFSFMVLEMIAAHVPVPLAICRAALLTTL